MHFETSNKANVHSNDSLECLIGYINKLCDRDQLQCEESSQPKLLLWELVIDTSPCLWCNNNEEVNDVEVVRGEDGDSSMEHISISISTAITEESKFEPKKHNQLEQHQFEEFVSQNASTFFLAPESYVHEAVASPSSPIVTEQHNLLTNQEPTTRNAHNKVMKQLVVEKCVTVTAAAAADKSYM